MSGSTGSTARTVRHLEPHELTSSAAGLLSSGRRLALVTLRIPGAAIDVPHAIYLFLAPAPATNVELRIALDPARPDVPDLGPLSLPAGWFARELRATAGALAAPSMLPRQPATAPVVSKDKGPRTPPAPAASRGAGPRPFPLLSARGTLELAGQQLTEGLAAVERCAGDTPVGHALAYCRAVEDALGLTVPEDARRMRAVLVELERLYRHVHDLASLCRIVGLADTHETIRQFLGVLQRANQAMTGSRSLRGGILVAGACARRRVDADALVDLGETIRQLVESTLADPAVVDRLTGSATLTTAQARDLGVLGVVARASGVDVDARRDYPTDVLADFGLQLGDILAVPVETEGDVLARFRQRGTEIAASIAVLDTLVRTVSPGMVTNWPTLDYDGPGPAGASGVGISEGWRGTIVHRVEIDPSLRLADVRAVDPSFFNAAALRAILGDIAPDDVPLAWASFNAPSP